MKFTGAAACFYVAIDLAGKATGDVSQSIFNPQHIWLWWIFAGLWAISAFQFLCSGE